MKVLTKIHKQYVISVKWRHLYVPTKVVSHRESGCYSMTRRWAKKVTLGIKLKIYEYIYRYTDYVSM